MLPTIIFSQLRVSTDDPDATYEAGQLMNFVVTGGSGTATYTINYDHGITAPVSSGTIQLNGFSTNIPFRLNEPGTVICTVTNNGQGDAAGAAFSPFDIQPYEADPFDFDIFWNTQKNKLAAVPLNPQFFEVATWDNRTRTYQFSLGMIDNRRVHGYISIPLNGSNLPAVITHAAFGVGPNICVPRPEIAADLNAISVSIWMHNTSPDQQSVDAYKPMQWDDANSNYYRYGVLGIMRAIDYVYTRPEFRGSGIGLNGISEGGGMSLLTAGVDNRVTAVSASIFAHSEHTGYKYGKASGFPHYLQQAPLVIRGVNVEAVNQATKYFDVVRAAKRFEGPVMAAIGYEDLTSIPMAQFGGFNQLKGSTVMIHKVDWGHRNPDEFYLGKFEFFRKHLNLSGQKGYYANAGTDQTVSGSATLSANIEKFGSLDFSLPVEWKMVSGPGTVNFTSRNNRTTNANFSANGTYILRVTATDKSMLNTSKTYYTISDHLKITVGNTNTNSDNDNDGVPTNADCNDFNPNISSPGDPCNDFNPNTFNDVIQADCSCAGATTPCANQGGDADGDGVCAFEDCNDFNQFISRPGDACNDFNPNTQNDVIQADCSCRGTTLDPCASQGGDTDGDGVCDFQDCNRFNPNIARPGDACDDFDPNTSNDVIQTDCSCQGTRQPTTTSGCIVDYNVVGNVVTINSLNYAQNIVILFDTNFNKVTSCEDWGNRCNTTQQFTLPYTGKFYLQIQTFANTSSTPICTIFEELNANTAPPLDLCAARGGDSDGDGVCDLDDCNRFNPNISTPGDSCNDGNPNTTNDVIQSNCTCAGTQTSNNTCTVNYTLSRNTVTVSGLNYTHNIVGIYDANFTKILSCEDWGNGCNETQQFTLPYSGTFFIQIQTYRDWSNPVCNIFETLIEGNEPTPPTNTCNNITNGGSISGNDNLCRGDDASPIRSTTLPSGGSGTVEYQWLSSTASCPISTANSIPGANASSYDPGPLNETTYFRRLSRRAGCTDWSGVSNCIVKTIQDCGNPNGNYTNYCQANYSINGSIVTVSNVTQPFVTIKITRVNNNRVVYSCETGGRISCGENTSIRLNSGRYYLQINSAISWEQGNVCTIFEEIQINGNRLGYDSDEENAIVELESLEALEKNEKIKVFPNPANELINIEINQVEEKETSILLINQLGKIVRHANLASKGVTQPIQFSTDGLAKGIYFVRITSKGKVPTTKKILVL